MKNYRDNLIKKIKMAGQEIIDRAESMVSEDTDLITNFQIIVDFPNHFDRIDPIDIEFRTKVASKHYIAALKDGSIRP